MSSEILQTGLQLVKSAIDADNQKNYSLACNLYDQAVLNLKLALVAEREPSKNALISSKIEEYSQRNKFIKNLLSQQPQSSQPSQPQQSQFSFPSVPSSISPSINQQQQQQQQQINNNNNSILSSFPSAGNTNNNNNNTSNGFSPPNLNKNEQLSKLNSLSIGNNQSTNRQLSRVEAYEAAKNFSLKGRKEEEVKNYRGASQCYEEACNYYLMAIKSEPDPTLKKNLSDEAKIYLDRIEVLKPFAASQPQPQQPQQPQPQQPQQQQFQQQSYNNNNSTQSMLSSFPSFNGSTNSLNNSLNNSNNNFNQILTNSNMPIAQQNFLQNHQFNQSNNSFNNATSSLPLTFSGDKCAACDALLSTNSIKALDRNWHAECFQVSIICAGCQKPFALSNLSLKVKDNRAYHPMCFESTTGLSQEEIRTFVGSSKQLFFSIQLQRKFYRAGETIQFGFTIDNGTTKKVEKVVAYLLMTETRMEITGTAYERKPKRTIKKLGRCEFHHSNRFPLIKDRFEGDFFYSIPPNILPSEVTGVDASFVREYQLIVKCVGPPLKIMTVKLKFNLTILDK
ncbi:LIM-type zinc finger-containing protein [Dictyostelium discoideum AX4]|uniref:Arrestin domain-containing protein E n=1 Tax=Dictyostelium discoideum TaxID=44689 RepID=ADCE_DICDI|nr:LIM-type zinc finger-containing protein [Dictyostelium discoideum AX4]Q55GN8.1 RecName: Full=Arrestin domain-containing protein E [Dictyostelium discoideum]EAL73245.1 LIM-type zinc finger-containing protein [Dictyostelium discoideum AX4]|eukprot:XP_647146.1 LIM-type zinc finger-containing protein [Dictyostelium discoideum AX4]